MSAGFRGFGVLNKECARVSFVTAWVINGCGSSGAGGVFRKGVEGKQRLRQLKEMVGFVSLLLRSWREEQGKKRVQRKGPWTACGLLLSQAMERDCFFFFFLELGERQEFAEWQ